MLYNKISDMWLERIGKIPQKWKRKEGRVVLISVDRRHPARMLMKMQHLKYYL